MYMYVHLYTSLHVHVHESHLYSLLNGEVTDTALVGQPEEGFTTNDVFHIAGALYHSCKTETAKYTTLCIRRAVLQFTLPERVLFETAILLRIALLTSGLESFAIRSRRALVTGH